MCGNEGLASYEPMALDPRDPEEVARRTQPPSHVSRFGATIRGLGTAKGRRKGWSTVAETETQELERLRRENAALKEKPAAGALTFKVSEKGACSVYGMGRFPVTLYKEQWARLFAAREELQAFLAANDSKLKSKGGE